MTESARLLMLVGAAPPPGWRAVAMAFAAEAARVGSALHVMLFLENLIRALLIFNEL